MEKVYTHTGYLLFGPGHHVQGVIDKEEALPILAHRGFLPTQLDWTYQRWNGTWSVRSLYRSNNKE